VFRPCPRLHFASLPIFLAVSAAGYGQAGDPTLQRTTTATMAGRRGAAAIVDVHSGRLLAAYHADVAARRMAHPGSSIKPFTLLALLQAGKVDAHTELVCKRRLTIGAHRLDCTHPDTKQPLGPAAALAYSCNSYFTEVATRLTPAELRAGFVRIGLTSATGLAPHEAVGQVALAQSSEQLQLQAIGEWGINVTALELLRGYRNLALLSQTNPDARIAALLAEGLEASVSYGMARSAQPESAMKVAGKTGTAPSDEGPWQHGWFAGYAPAGNPEIALVIFLENGHGSDAAALAGRIFAAFAAGHDKHVAKPAASSQR